MIKLTQQIAPPATTAITDPTQNKSLDTHPQPSPLPADFLLAHHHTNLIFHNRDTTAAKCFHGVTW